MNRRHLLAQLAAAAVCSPARAADGERPLRLVVPYAPGGTTDRLGRLLGQRLAPLIGRAIVVENVPGAGSSLGAAQVARAAEPALLMATSTTLAINPWLQPRLPYAPQDDFAPIGLVAAVPLVLLVPAAAAIRDVAALLALADARPDGLLYGSAGVGTPQHLAAELFQSATGAQLTHVPYGGSAPALVDLVAGRIELMFSDVAPALPHLRAGRLRALGVTSARPQPSLPGVPSLAASGAAGTQGFEAVAWQALVASATMDEALRRRCASALQTVMANADVQGQLQAEGVEPRSSGPDELAATIRSETARWGRLIRTRLPALQAGAS